MNMTFLLYFVVPLVLGVVILGAGVVVLVLVARRRGENNAADISEWASTGGKVLSSAVQDHEVQNNGKTELAHEPMVEYVYSVDGEEYHGNKVFPGESMKIGSSDAQEILKKYPVGAYVSVLFNPQHPAESALMPRREKPDYLLMAGYLFTGFGVSVCCFTGLMSVVILGAVR